MKNVSTTPRWGAGLKTRLMSIRAKILLSNAALLIILILVLGYALKVLQNNQQIISQQAQVLAAQEEVRTIQKLFADLSYASMSFLVLLQDSAKEQRDSNYGQLRQAFSQNSDPAITALVPPLDIYFQQIDEATKSFLDDDRILGYQGLVLADQTAEEQINAKLDRLVEENRRQVDEIGAELKISNQNVSNALYLLFGTMIVVGAAMSIFLARMISTSIASLRQTIEHVEQSGDLRGRADVGSSDEIGALAQAFNLFLDSLSGIVRDVKTRADELATSSSQLTSVSVENSANVTRQQEEVSAVASASEQMMTSIQKVTENAENTFTTIRQASKRAEQGKDQVDTVVSMINDLAAEVANVETLVRKVIESGNRIGGISDTIQNITRQTNMLALNAAIEAAKAGEHGVGFAVVAKEVQDLARRTHEATVEIQGMINDLQETSAEAEAAMARGRSQTESSVAVADATGTLINDNYVAMGLVAQLAKQISEATRQQADMSRSVNGNLSTIIETADLSQASSQEIQQASATLLRMADSLRESADRFSV